MESFAFLFETQIPVYEIALRLALALVLSMALGYEREAFNKPAGLRTHMLVALAACAFTIVALEMVAALDNTGDPTSVAADPTRVIEAVVTGVAFLGAGTIIQARGNVIGITTGASIWLAGAIGLSCGGGYYIIAVITLALALITLTALGAIAQRMLRRGRDDGEM